MARVKRAVNAQKKRRTVLESASGYRGQRSRLYRKAKEQMLHSMQYAYRDRRDRKGDFRQLWITRINAGARANGMTYNRLIQGLTPGRCRGGPQDPRRPGRQRRRRRSPRWSRSLARPCRPRASAAPRLRPPDPHAHCSPGAAPFTPRTPRVVAARRLQRRRDRDTSGRFLAEGPQAVREALAAPGCVVELFATADALDPPRHARRRGRAAPRCSLVTDDGAGGAGRDRDSRRASWRCAGISTCRSPTR